MAQRTDEERRAASKDLLYELDMMCETARVLEQMNARAKTRDEVVTRNALLESLLIHARCLVVFLGWHGKRPHPDDVRVSHYIKDFRTAPPPNEWLEELYTAASVRVAHISYERAAVDPMKKDWPIRDIVQAINDEILRFARIAPSHLLDDGWRKPRGPVFSAHSTGSPRVPTMPAQTAVTDSTTLITMIKPPKKP
jgi:hypothetical protein